VHLLFDLAPEVLLVLRVLSDEGSRTLESRDDLEPPELVLFPRCQPDLPRTVARNAAQSKRQNPAAVPVQLDPPTVRCAAAQAWCPESSRSGSGHRTARKRRLPA